MKVVQIPLLRDNYGYLVVCETTGEAAVVDPLEGEPVLRRAEKEKVRLKAILNTHHNLYFYLDTMREIRNAITLGTFETFKREFLRTIVLPPA